MAIDNNNKEGSDPGEIDLASHLLALTLNVIGQVAFSHEFHVIERVKQWANNNQKNVGDGKLNELDDPFITAMMETFKITFLATAIFFLGDVWHWVDKRLNPKTRLLH
jgi:hypothetical protein